jgi:hypothetical protein
MMIRLVIIIFIFTAFSCSKQITYTPDYEDKVVVNASISPQKGVEVRLSKSISPSTKTYYLADDLKLSDAVVELYRSDSLVAVLQETEKGLYKSANNLIIQEDESYHLKVNATDLPEVTTEKVTIPKALTNTGYTFERFDEIKGELIVRFENTDFTPFFAIELLGEDELNQPLTIYSFLTDYDDEGLCETAWGPAYSFLNTNCFLNELVNVRKEVGNLNDSNLLSDYRLSSPVKKLKVKLKNVNEAFFRYAQTYRIENGFFESVSSDLQITYSNIEGGYGIFVAENMVSYEFEL